MNINQLKTIAALLACATFIGCGEQDGLAATGGTPGTGGNGGAAGAGGTGGTPAMGQIDRIGRPAINTALTQTFNPDSTVSNTRKDDYNAAGNPSEWSEFAPEFAASLAILDSLDTDSAAETGCGTQLAIGPSTEPGGETRYDALAGVLADDQLYVNSTSNLCVAYLGVEAEALGVVQDGGCGGRTPQYDVIDDSYSVLAAGTLTGVGDGVDENAEGFLDGFPFLAPPNE